MKTSLILKWGQHVSNLLLKYPYYDYANLYGLQKENVLLLFLFSFPLFILVLHNYFLDL